MPNEKLMDYFQFNEIDLQSNREGHLSEPQKERLLKVDNYRKRSARGNGFLLFLLAIAGLIIPMIISFFHGSANFTLGAIWFVVWIAIALWVTRPAFVKFDEVVQKAQGPITIAAIEKSWTRRYGPRHYYDIYELRVDGHAFRVLSDAAKFMSPNDVYAIYFTGGSPNDVLSAEFISPKT